MQRGALASAARSDGQRSALDPASHRTAPNALQRNEKRKIILPRHHEDFRPNSQTLQPKQESNLTKSAEDFNPNRGAVRQNQLGTLTLSTEYFDEARLPLRTSEKGPLKQGKWSAQITRPPLRNLPKSRPSPPLSGPFYFKISLSNLHGKYPARRAGAAGKSPSIPNKTEKELKDF